MLAQNIQAANLQMVATNAALVDNLFTMRQEWLRALYDPARNVDRECGHPLEVTINDYVHAYERGDIAARIVELYPKESWVQRPDVYETEEEDVTDFEKAWTELSKKLSIYPFLQRADILSGIGRFGIILLGFDDGGNMEDIVPSIGEDGNPVEGGKPSKLLYLRVFEENVVYIQSLQSDVKNPRYGLPQFYNIQFQELAVGVAQQTPPTVTRKVHWSRIIHVCDNRTNSEVYGQPRMKRVYNRLLGLAKVAGGSPEMYWKGGFPGISIQSHPSINPADIDFDKEDTKKQMALYQEGFQRYIATIGMDIKSLRVEISDPTPHFLLQMKLLAAAMACPWRILAGAEVGQLSSDQDTENWTKRIVARRIDYVDPFIIRPFVDRLLLVGSLPQPGANGYKIAWPDLHTPSGQEIAEVADKRANALAKYIQAGGDAVITPFYFFTLVLEMTDEEAESVIAAVQKHQASGEPRLGPPPAPPAPPNGTPEQTQGRRNGALNPANNVTA